MSIFLVFSAIVVSIHFTTRPRGARWWPPVISWEALRLVYSKMKILEKAAGLQVLEWSWRNHDDIKESGILTGCVWTITPTCSKQRIRASRPWGEKWKRCLVKLLLVRFANSPNFLVTCSLGKMPRRRYQIGMGRCLVQIFIWITPHLHLNWPPREKIAAEKIIELNQQAWPADRPSHFQQPTMPSRWRLNPILTFSDSLGLVLFSGWVRWSLSYSSCSPNSKE